MARSITTIKRPFPIRFKPPAPDTFTREAAARHWAIQTAARLNTILRRTPALADTFDDADVILATRLFNLECDPATGAEYCHLVREVAIDLAVRNE